MASQSLGNVVTRVVHQEREASVDEIPAGSVDRVLIINQGRIVAQGTSAELRREILGHSTYRLELAGDRTRLEAQLAAIDPRLRLTDHGDVGPDGFAAVTLRTEQETDLGEALLRQLPAAGWRLRALTREHPNLEDLFLAATRRSWDAVDKRPTPVSQEPRKE